MMVAEILAVLVILGLIIYLVGQTRLVFDIVMAIAVVWLLLV